MAPGTGLFIIKIWVAGQEKAGNPSPPSPPSPLDPTSILSFNSTDCLVISGLSMSPWLLCNLLLIVLWVSSYVETARFDDDVSCWDDARLCTASFSASV